MQKPYKAKTAWRIRLSSLGDISNPLYTLDEIFSCIEQADKKCIIAIDKFQQIELSKKKLKNGR